jgi:hypothetical protein
VVNVRVDERLVVETDFAARCVSGIVALEGAEAVDEAVGLRAVVVRQDRQIETDDGVLPLLAAVPASATWRLTVIVSVPPVSCQSSSLPPPSGSVALARFGFRCS